jgi:hypothetical protein
MSVSRNNTNTNTNTNTAMPEPELKRGRLGRMTVGRYETFRGAKPSRDTLVDMTGELGLSADAHPHGHLNTFSPGKYDSSANSACFSKCCTSTPGGYEKRGLDGVTARYMVSDGDMMNYFVYQMKSLIRSSDNSDNDYRTEEDVKRALSAWHTHYTSRVLELSATPINFLLGKLERQEEKMAQQAGELASLKRRMDAALGPQSTAPETSDGDDDDECLEDAVAGCIQAVEQAVDKRRAKRARTGDASADAETETVASTEG